ncbi:CAP-gly domain-containing linker protein 1 [Colletotrichum incanum]|nr:CAP-gly domain-containing linker protein 1 [Colletotrichum incanum]
MRGFDPINVALAYCASVNGLRALSQAASQLFHYLPEFSELPAISDNLKEVVGFWIFIHALLAAPFVYLYTLNPFIRHFVPSLGCSDEFATRIDRQMARYSIAAFLPYFSTGCQASVTVVSYLCRAMVKLATSATDKIPNKAQGIIDTEVDKAFLKIDSELTAERQAAEARRCRLPSPVCESARYQLDVKWREVNDLARQLGEAEQRELDTKTAMNAERTSRKLIQQRLVRTEQQLSRYGPEAKTIQQLESLLAESEEKVSQANIRADKAERLLKTEVENSKWIIDRKDAHGRKLRDDAGKVALAAKDKIGVMSAEIASLRRQLDAARWNNTPADIEAMLAQKDETIQFLIEAGLAVEKDRDEKMSYAEVMYSSLETENRHLRQQLHDSTRASQAVGNDAEVCSLQDALADAHKQIQTADVALFHNQTKVDELENRFKEVTDESKKVMADATSQISKLTTEFSAGQENLIPEMRKEGIEGFNCQMEELRNQLTAAHANHASEMNQASAIHTEQQHCIASLHSKMNTSNNENVKLRQEVSRLQDLHHQQAVSDANGRAFEQRFAALQYQHQMDLDQARTLFGTKDSEIKHLQDSLVVARAHISSLREEVAEMQGCVDGHDNEVEILEKTLRQALTNEKKAINRFAEIEEKRRKEATADLLKYNRLRVEYNKASQERDSLAAGNQANEVKNHCNHSTVDVVAARDTHIEDSEGQVTSKTSKVGTEQAGPNMSNETQNNQATSQKQMHLYTNETEKKQQKALELINRAQWLEDINDEDSEKGTRSDDDTEMASTQAYNATDTQTENEKKRKEKEDEEFETAMNNAINDSNHEYNSRTAAAFKTSIQAPGVRNPFALPGPPTTAPNFSTMFSSQAPVPAFGQQTATMPSPEKPSTPDSTTEKHLKSGVTFWVPKNMSPGTRTSQQQQEQRNVFEQVASNTLAPIPGRKLKRPATRRLSHTKEQQLPCSSPSPNPFHGPAPKYE